MNAPLTIGGAPVMVLEARDAPAEGPALLAAEVLPGRGMMLLQARLRLPSGEVVDAIHAPAPAVAAQALSGGPDDFNGDKSFSFGGAILVPYANRITGAHVAGAREIATTVGGQPVRLPANWGGGPARDEYAMHGLILDKAFEYEQPSPDRLTGRLSAGDFGCGWPGSAEIEVVWRLAGGGLSVRVAVANRGPGRLPLGVGWHPYFALPSGRREQARLHLAAAARVEVDDYQQVLPTGRVLPTGGSDYDFSAQDGAALGDRYLDDCFTELARRDGLLEARILDPAAGVGLRIVSPSSAVRAVQVYAPPNQAFVVVEPQFNLADPYGREWPHDVATGMVDLEPGGRTTYEASIIPFAIPMA